MPRVGDWATWTVRVAGSDGMTRLTWRIVSLDAIQAGVSITSATTDGSGRDLSASETQTKIDLAKLRPTSRLQGATPSEPVVVGARRIPVRVAFVGETKAWVSDEVPVTGLVRSTGPGGTEQVLVDFGRGG